ncbi:MAG TPA: FAD-binding oxidoreductase [Polyangiaceae bacterium]|nr:FAD-binding oxidoreductase [Polyangiaceae bacterium]
MRPSAPFFDAIERDFAGGLVTRDPADLAEYGRDWTRVIDPAPCAIAFPRSTDEVARLVRLCAAHCVPLVPSGGRTGLAGGAVAAKGELVLSLARMRAMQPVDAVGCTVRVQAGAVTQAVHEHCAPHGLTWPVDFASKGSSTIGGNIATNAGGVKVIRWGLTRQWVLGLQVVLATGEVVELNGALEKNNTGLDLRQLFIGSEGTLGVVTEATLKLAHTPPRAEVVLFAADDLAGVVRLFREARFAPFVLAAYEMFTDACLARVLAHRKLRAPLATSAPFYVLIELEGVSRDALESWVMALFEKRVVRDGVLAQNAAEARDLWSLRESISESLSATGFPHKNDIALPIAALEAFCSELGEVFARRYPGWEICLFGHIGDGNLHVNVMKPEGSDKASFLARTEDADRDLFDLVRRHAGSISAEHGVGLLKKPWLGWSHTPQELAAMRAVKRALDPTNLLNPGKIFDMDP